MCGIKIASKGDLAGLAKEVVHAASQLYNISGIRVGQPRRYRGEPKVKIPEKWPKGVLLVIACDEYGQREIALLVEKKRRAILRHLLAPLVREGIICELRGES